MKLHQDRSITDNTVKILLNEDFLSRASNFQVKNMSHPMKLKLHAVIEFCVKQKKFRCDFSSI